MDKREGKAGARQDLSTLETARSLVVRGSFAKVALESLQHGHSSTPLACTHPRATCETPSQVLLGARTHPGVKGWAPYRRVELVERVQEGLRGASQRQSDSTGEREPDRETGARTLT